jgi:peptidyl-prolyl cis-trans isomerase C
MNVALFPDVHVNGTTIASAAIAAEAQSHEAPKGKPGLAWRKAARALIVRELLMQEAARLKLTSKPELLSEGKRETEEEALIREVLDQHADYEQPTEAEVRALWEEDPERFKAPPLWEVSHILCAAEPGDDAALAQAEARATTLLSEIGKNPKAFVRAAREHSDCGSKSNNGALGQLSPGDTVPEFEAALRVMQEGEISGEPLRTRFGFHIIRLDAVAKGAVLPYEAVAPKIKLAIEKSRWAKAVHKLTNELVGDASIDGIDITAI